MVKKVGICKRKEYKNENLKNPFMFIYYRQNKNNKLSVH